MYEENNFMSQSNELFDQHLNWNINKNTKTIRSYVASNWSKYVEIIQLF